VKPTEQQIKVQEEKLNKIPKGLDLAYERMLEFKRYKKSKVVTMRDGQIVETEP